MARSRPTGAGIVVRLQFDHPVTLNPERVPAVLGAQAPTWLGEEAEEARPGWRSFLCDLELHAGGHGPSVFRKAAVVSIAEPVRKPGGWIVPVEWKASSMSALFPVFAGQLEINADRIQIDGRYAPPGGRLGYALDVALLGAAARQTARWFMRRLAEALA
jgi:hypothetical protein